MRHLPAVANLRTALLGLAATAACGTGSVEVVLERPASAEAQLESAATAVLRAERLDDDAVVLTAPVRDGAITFGDLPVGDYHAVSVELYGATGAGVGFGRAGEPVSVTADADRVVRIPIRRPRVYLAGPAPGRVVEAPLDGSTARVIRVDRGGAALDVDSISLPASTALIAAAGADMFVASGGAVFRLDTSSDRWDATALVDVGAEIRDLAGSADGAHLVAGSTTGLHVIDVRARTSTAIPVEGGVHAVATALAPNGGVAAIALVGAIRDPSGCPGASRLLVAGIGDLEGGTRMIDLGTGVAAIAAAPTRPLAVAAAYCTDEVVVIDLASDRVWGRVGGVEAPTAVAATDQQAWAIGAIDGEVTMPGTKEENVVRGAHHQLAIVDLSGSAIAGRTVELPEIGQPIRPSDDPGSSLSQFARAKLATAASLSLSARGDQMLVSSNAVYRVEQVTIRDSIFGELGVFPPMAVHTSSQYVLSTSTGALELVIATRCKVCTADDHTATLDYGEGCGTTDNWGYPNWECAPSQGVIGVGGVDFETGASAALYGRP